MFGNETHFEKGRLKCVENNVNIYMNFNLQVSSALLFVSNKLILLKTDHT